MNHDSRDLTFHCPVEICILDVSIFRVDDFVKFDRKLPLLAMIALSAVQSCEQKFIHNTIMFIDTSNNT